MSEALSSMRGHAVILGWAGSTLRQLRTVDAWYRERGLTTLATVPRIFRAMAFPRGWEREGRRLAEALIDRVQPGERIIVHAFSNAGFWTYAATIRELARDSRGRAVLDAIAALVLDSAPGYPERLEPRFTARYSAMAMMPLVLRALGRPPETSHPLLDPPLLAFMRLWYHLSPQQIRAAEESLELVRRTGEWPFFALYSSADTLVEARYVEDFLASARARGRQVREVRWDDSEHVRHMIVHREAYRDALEAFVSEVLDGRRASSAPSESDN